MSVAGRLAVFERVCRNKPDETYVYDDGIVKAFLTIGPCRDADKLLAFELWDFYVDPLIQRQGIGTVPVKFCLEQAAARHFNKVTLWVLEKNENARQFYEHMGFRADGERKYVDQLCVFELRYAMEI